MGRTARPKPQRLGEKLLKIRESLGLSQNQMLVRLGLPEGIDRSVVSGYELGTREPTLPILVAYGEIAGVWVDVLIDDRRDLPKKLPANQRDRLK
jgi:transcriptional regulator with XRE-family HTH domain